VYSECITNDKLTITKMCSPIYILCTFPFANMLPYSDSELSTFLLYLCVYKCCVYINHHDFIAIPKNTLIMTTLIFTSSIILFLHYMCLSKKKYFAKRQKNKFYLYFLPVDATLFLVCRFIQI